MSDIITSAAIQGGFLAFAAILGIGIPAARRAIAARRARAAFPRARVHR